MNIDILTYKTSGNLLLVGLPLDKSVLRFISTRTRTDTKE